MESKFCNKCKETKSLDKFTKYMNRGKERIYSYCKICKNEIARNYNKNHRDQLKKYYQDFKIRNPEYNTQYQKQYYLTNINNKIFRKIMSKIKRLISKEMLVIKEEKEKEEKEIKNIKEEKEKEKEIEEIIGCKIDFLIRWLNFSKSFNCLESDNICLEHLIPISNFDLRNEKEIKKCFNWKNLRYFSKVQNSRKNVNIKLEDKIRHKYLIHCYINVKTKTIEYKTVY